MGGNGGGGGGFGQRLEGGLWLHGPLRPERCARVRIGGEGGVNF